MAEHAAAVGLGSAASCALPKSLRPATLVYAEVDLFAGSQGRLQIQPNGVVTVYAENGALANATDFTSLDGVWFAR